MMKSIKLAGCLLLPASAIVNADILEEIIIRDVYKADAKTPVSYQNIGASTLKQQPPLQEPSFILNKTPSITAYSDSGSYQGYSYFRLRGMDQTRINMTLDGIPLNEPEDQGVYFSNYPGIWGALAQVQIQRGVGTTQNGTASFAGSVQLNSVDLNTPERASVELGLGSFGTYSASADYLSGAHNNKSVYVRASGVQSDGYKYNAQNQSYSIFASAQSKDANGAWKLLAFSGQQKNDMAWLGVDEQAIANDRRTNANNTFENEDDKFEQSLISLAREQQLADNLQLNIRAYYNHLEGNYDFDLNTFLGLDEPGELYNYALKSDFTGFFTTLDLDARNYQLVAGFHLNQYSRDHTGREQSLGQIYTNTGDKNEASVFVKGDYKVGRVTLYGDIQHRQTTFDYSGTTPFEKMDWQFTNIRAGASIEISEHWQGYYSAGKTSREPTRSDLFGGNDNLEVDEDGQALLFVVDPEDVLNHELGVRLNGQRQQAALNLFYMDFDNEITLNGNFGPNGLLLNQDVEKSVRQGIELTAAQQLPNQWELTQAITYQEGNIHDRGATFDPVQTPNWLVNLGIQQQLKNLAYGLHYRYQGQSYIDLSNAQALEGFSQWDAFLAYSWQKLSARLTVNNCLGADYYASGVMDIYGQPSYFVGAPLNAVLALNWTL